MAGLQTEPGASNTAATRDETAALAARALAHDFNNLLAAVIGHASYLRMITEPGSEADQTAATIEMVAVRAKGLAAQLHQLGNQLSNGSDPANSAANLTLVDLHAIVKEVVATLQTGPASSVRFRLLLAAPDPAILGDVDQLNQLVMNLVINACEAMGADGGDLTITTSPFENGVQLEVCDSGPGIPAEHRAKLFDPSYSTKQAGGGMGLAIVQRIAHLHGAAIEARDNPPRGTVFSLRFPALTLSREPHGEIS